VARYYHLFAAKNNRGIDLPPPILMASRRARRYTAFANE